MKNDHNYRNSVKVFANLIANFDRNAELMAYKIYEAINAVADVKPVDGWATGQNGVRVCFTESENGDKYCLLTGSSIIRKLCEKWFPNAGRLCNTEEPEFFELVRYYLTEKYVVETFTDSIESVLVSRTGEIRIVFA